MDNFFITVLSLTVSGTIVAAIIFLTVKLFKHRFSKTWQYYIWLILMVRLIMPITIEANITEVIFQKMTVSTTNTRGKEGMRNGNDSPEAANLIESKDNGEMWVQDIPVVNDMEGVVSGVVLNGSNNSNSINIVDNLWIIWLIGICFILTVKLVDYINFIHYIKAGNKRVEDPAILSIFDDCTMEMKVNRNLSIYHNGLISTPMLIGLWRPFIVLPDNSIRTEQFRYIFYHELIHFKRKDILYKWLIQLVSCVHWFNPFMYWIQKEINLVCELSCDEMTLGYLNKEEQRAYGNTLISIAEKEVKFRHNIVSTTLIEGKHNMKERLRSIMNYRELSRASIICSIFMVGVILTIALAAGAVTTRAGEATKIAVADSVVIEESVEAKEGVSWSDSSLDGFEEGSFSALSYSSGDGISAKRLNLEGNHVLAIIESDSVVPIEITYKANVKKGNFDLVAYNNSGNMTLFSGTDDDTKSFNLPAGVTILAFTGKDSSVSSLKVKLNDGLTTYVDTIFYSLSDYKAELLVRGLMRGEVAKMADFSSIAYYLNQERLDECIKVFLEKGNSFTAEELMEINAYLSPTSRALCLEVLIAENKMDADELIQFLPFMNSDDSGKFVVSMIKQNDEFDIDDFMTFVSFMDSEAIGNCVIYLSEHGKIDVDDLTQLTGYLDAETMNQCVQSLIGNSTFSGEDLESIMYTMDNETLKSSILQLMDEGKLDYDILVDMAGNFSSDDLAEIVREGLKAEGSKAISLDHISELAPYLDSESLGTCIDNIISKKEQLDLDFVMHLTSYADSETIGRCMIYAARNNKDVDLDLLVELSSFANSEDVEKTAQILIKERDMNLSDLSALFSYF